MPTVPLSSPATDVLASIGDAILFTDSGGTVRYLNPAAQDRFVGGRDSGVGRGLAEVLGLADDSELRQCLHRATSERIRTTHIVGPRDGGAAWSLTLHPSEQGVAVVVQDVPTTSSREQILLDDAERHRLALDASQVGTWRHELAAGRVYLDARAAGHFGFPGPGFVRPEEVSACIQTEDHEAFGRMLETGDVRESAEVRAIRPDGEPRWLAVEAFGEPDAQGNGGVRWGTTRDVSPRQVTHERLRQNQETFQALIENNPFGLYVVDSDFRFRLVSAGARAAFHNVRPLIGRDFADVVRTIWPEPFASEVIARFRRTLETGEPHVEGQQVKRRQDSGAVEAYDWRIERISLPDGRHGVVCFFYDLSERLRWEDALTQSRTRLHLALRASKMGVWEFDLGTGAVAWSEEAFSVCGFAPGEFGGSVEDFFAMVHPDDLPRLHKEVQATLAGSEGFSTQFRIIRKDGQIRWVENLAELYRDATGHPLSLVGTVRDITEERAAARELADYREQLESLIRERTAELEASNRELEGFVHSVAHDLRAPLRAINSTSHLLREVFGEGVDPEVRRLLDRQEFNSLKLANLIGDLLEYARLGRLRVVRNEIDLTELVHGLIQTSGRGAHVFSVEPGLVASGDRSALRVLLRHLLSNAVKYSPSGGTIQVGCQDGAFFVRDQGIGFEMAYAERIFRPFERLHGDADYPGTGIGLANVARVAERHGGRAWAESTPGQGSTFWFTLGEGPTL